MSNAPREGTETGVGDGAKPSSSRLQRVGVGLLAGGTTALVALLFAPVVAVTTPIQFSLAQLGAVAGVVGLAVAADGVRQPTPRLVVIRTSYLVTALVVVSGVALGVSLWLQLAPAQREGQYLRYAPLIPVVTGGLLGLIVGGFGTLYRRRTTPRAYE
jgi:hypothetical protein